LATLEFAPAIINLRRSVVERLSREVWRAFESTPPPGMEIGGLLLGTAARLTRVIEIEDFEPLLCESGRHPFVLSESNCRALQKTLAASGSRSNGRLNVVGCYRSHIGEDLRLSAHDLLFAQRCFQAPAGVFMMIKPSSGEALTGAFCSWENRLIDFGYTLQEFSFDARQLADEPGEPCGPNASEHTEATQLIDDRPQAALPVSLTFPEAWAMAKEKVGTRVLRLRGRARVWRAAALLARTRTLGGLRTLLCRTRTLRWRARTLPSLWTPFTVARALSLRGRTRLWQAVALLARTRTLRALSTLLWWARALPWRARTLNALWCSSALLIIVVAVLAYRAYLNFGEARASDKDRVISFRARPSNVHGSQLEVLAKSMAPSKHTSRAPSPGATGQNAAPLKRLSATGGRARRKPRVYIGREPPFTCSAGDVFRKTDAVPGWNTFTCRSNNVWSITRTVDTL
jgi:proteasome lid subunit RPN8/RPN11